MKNTKAKNVELGKIILENYDIHSVTDIEDAIKDLLGETLQTALDAEFEDFMDYEKYEHAPNRNNYRNGTSDKTVLSSNGDIHLDVPRDRNGEFEPLIVPKNKRNISEIENKIIAMYARGMTTRDISDTIKEIYGVQVSATMISNITDKVLTKAEEWQNRPLRTCYPIVFIDAIHFSMRRDGVIKKVAAYIVLAINSDGLKEVLGIGIGDNESASYGMTVLNELKNRGVKNICILCSDNLSGIKEAVEVIYPKTVQQRCIIHMIRNSCKCVAYKDRRNLCNDLRKVYTAPTAAQGYKNLEKAEETWKSKYPNSLNRGFDNGEEISPFFDYSPKLRKIMYTTNIIESLNRVYRKFTKARTVFPSNQALFKCLYLTTQNISEKGTTPIPDWGVIYGQLNIAFPNMLEAYDGFN